MDMRTCTVILISLFTFVFITMAFEKVLAQEQASAEAVPEKIELAYLISFESQILNYDSEKSGSSKEIKRRERTEYARAATFSDEPAGDVGATGDDRDNIIFNTRGESQAPGKLADPTADQISDPDVRNSGVGLPAAPQPEQVGENDRFTTSPSGSNTTSNGKPPSNTIRSDDQVFRSFPFSERENFRAAVNDRIETYDQELNNLRSVHPANRNADRIRVLERRRNELNNRLDGLNRVRESEWESFMQDTQEDLREFDRDINPGSDVI